MICPQCQAEYRQGFTRCADCDVELVYEIPGASEELAMGPPITVSAGERMRALWAGEDPRIHSEICELLEQEDIPYKSVRREDHLFNLALKKAFQIAVPASLFDRASEEVKKLYLEDKSTQETGLFLPPGGEHATSSGTFSSLLDGATGYARNATEVEQDSAAEDSFRREPTSDDSETLNRQRASENWYPEDATAEVYSEGVPELDWMIESSLRENHIPARTDTLTDGSRKIFVLPDDAGRAREIIREITDGTPPE